MMSQLLRFQDQTAVNRYFRRHLRTSSRCDPVFIIGYTTILFSKTKKPAPISRSGPIQTDTVFYFAAAVASTFGASGRSARLIRAALPLRLRK